MPSDAKRVKILTLVALAAGAAAAVFGAVLLAQGQHPVKGGLVLMGGVVLLVINLRLARLANVPSNARLISRASGVGCAVELANLSTAVATVGAADVLALGAIAMGAVLCLAVCLSALVVKRRLERA
ncbi:hypothetical protein [Olsenella massiliensis]|uniref:hypothetical protein n=1 Tax=Olsenella massiliensis TaxID=1622075 RepID=UPI00071C4F6D|nr:hypothetical protein [Olsenella massiliensis]